MQNKQYYTKENLTPDINCALLPPVVITGELTKTRHYHPDYRGWQSAPCIVRTPGGRLLCTFSGDNSLQPDETPNNYNLICISDDDGATWREEWIIDHPDSVRMHEPILWIAPDGALWHFWAQSYNWWDGRAGVWAMRCQNPEAERLTWSQPRRLCHGVLATTPMAARNGEWYFPVSIWKHFPSTYNSLPELAFSNLYISRDSGETLEYVGSANEPTTTFDENCVTERPDGSFLMIMRTHNSIASSESFDRGKTWSTPVPMMDSPSSRSFLARFPSGNLLLIAHHDFLEPELDAQGNPTGRQYGNRKNMTAFLSEDGGKTWPWNLLLDSQRNISYPAGMITPDGRAYIAYDHERYRDREIWYASFTEEEIRQGQLIHPESFRKKLLCKSGRFRGENGKIYESGEDD